MLSKATRDQFHLNSRVESLGVLQRARYAHFSHQLHSPGGQLVVGPPVREELQ